MGMIQRKFLLVIMTLIVVIQIIHTVKNKVNWPFASHNFYYHRSPLIKAVYRIELEDDTHQRQVVDCRHSLPIEGYRCSSLYREVFESNNLPAQKNGFSQTVLNRLNNGGWMSFDERYPPALPGNGRRFISLRVLKQFLDTRSFSKTKKTKLVKEEILYNYSGLL